MNRIVKAKIPGRRYGYRYILECTYCHKEFSINGTHFKEGVGKFCSRSCHIANKNTLNKGESSNNWKGGEIVTTEGYIRIYTPNHPQNRFGYVLKHRLIIEAKLGRYLKKHEIVHHKNHNKKDNRIENLIVLSKSKHSIHHYPTNMKNVIRDKFTGRFIHK